MLDCLFIGLRLPHSAKSSTTNMVHYCARATGKSGSQQLASSTKPTARRGRESHSKGHLPQSSAARGPGPGAAAARSPPASAGKGKVQAKGSAPVERKGKPGHKPDVEAAISAVDAAIGHLPPQEEVKYTQLAAEGGGAFNQRGGDPAPQNPGSKARTPQSLEGSGWPRIQKSEDGLHSSLRFACLLCHLQQYLCSNGSGAG